uniref:Uncharacterized protein n=1 Tax=Lepeophtheirus salmonis TaxID=72036 RepID=A0A0K2UB85_LEPSM
MDSHLKYCKSFIYFSTLTQHLYWS